MKAANDAYYRRPSPGRSDYWRKTAAPRLRVRYWTSEEVRALVAERR